MNLEAYLQAIQGHLIQTHAQVLGWFEGPDEVKRFRPAPDRWTILEILEHISLTSHFLLKLIDKGAAKAQRNVKGLSLEKELDRFDFDLEKLAIIGQHKAFPWIRPAHMEPTGERSEAAIRKTLIQQLNRCLTHLENLQDGTGLLHQMTMTVHDLGKINVYEFIYFLSKHAERHLDQMRENRELYRIAANQLLPPNKH